MDSYAAWRLCFANIPSVRVEATSVAAAMRGYEAQNRREALERTAEMDSGQDSRVRSHGAIGRGRVAAGWSATPPGARRSGDAGRRPCGSPIHRPSVLG